MPKLPPNRPDHLEQARQVLWDAVQLIEEAQRVLFKAGDHYVADVWGDGVRSVLECTERLTDLTGDLTAIHIEIGRIARRSEGRGPPGNGRNAG